MQITFLGTSCAKPTKERNHSAIFLSYGSEGILFDCGEGTQRQMAIAGIKPSKVSKVFITHWHGDHVLGLPGLIQTLGLSDYDKTLKIFGPEGTEKRVKSLFEACDFEQRIDIEVKELDEGKMYSNREYTVEAYPVTHSTKTIGYRFIEKDKRKIKVSYIKKIGIPEGPLLGDLQDGKSIEWKGKIVSPKDATVKVKGKILAYIPDSGLCKNTLKIAENADLLISDATYTSDLEEKAEKHKHLTARQAGEVASQANVKHLVLTHYSARYKETAPLREDAKQVFDDVTCAEDFLKIKI